MDICAENVAEGDLPVKIESAGTASDGIVVDKSDEMHSQFVNGATDSIVSAAAGDKTGGETRCKLSNDAVKYEWTDITSDFIGACSNLELGELVHDSKYVASTEY